MKLQVIGQYANDVRNLRFAVGDQIEVSDEIGCYLLADAPGCFVLQPDIKQQHPANKAISKPPQDK